MVFGWRHSGSDWILRHFRFSRFFARSGVAENSALSGLVCDRVPDAFTAPLRLPLVGILPGCLDCQPVLFDEVSLHPDFAGYSSSSFLRIVLLHVVWKSPHDSIPRATVRQHLPVAYPASSPHVHSLGGSCAHSVSGQLHHLCDSVHRKLSVDSARHRRGLDPRLSENASQMARAIAFRFKKPSFSQLSSFCFFHFPTAPIRLVCI